MLQLAALAIENISCSVTLSGAGSDKLIRAMIVLGFYELEMVKYSYTGNASVLLHLVIKSPTFFSNVHYFGRYIISEYSWVYQP